MIAPDPSGKAPRGAHRKLGAAILGVGWLLAVAGAAHAQAPAARDPGGVTQEQVDEAFERMLNNPADLDLTFAFAELAVAAGNFEAAISALERMLLFNPDLPRIKLELGILYYRLGSFEAAQGYLEGAVAGADVPDVVRERVATYLADISRRASPHHLSGSVFVGWRYQQNANAGPGTTAVRALGQDATLGQEFVRQKDTNTFAAASASYVYDVQNQAGDKIESTAVVYYADQRRVDRLDLGLVEVTVGPRFGLEFLGPGPASVRPYLLANQIWLSDSPYFHTAGAGVALTKQVTPSLGFDATLERRGKVFRNDAQRPTARDQNSEENSLQVGVRWSLDESQQISLGVGLDHDETRAKFKRRSEIAPTAGYTLQYGAPFKITEQAWMVQAQASRVHAYYGDPDPGVDPDVTRKDKEWRLSLLNAVPLDEDLTVIAQAQRFKVDSNLLNFAYKNWSLTLGISRRF
ncbi:MAG: tetratricopeptide repeat protein [Pseudomonadota bacterium]